MTRPADVQPYDFRRPNRFSREHVRALQIVNETFARQFATVLSTTLRVASQVGVSAVSQLTYDEYVSRTPNPSLLTVLSLEPLADWGVFQLPMGIAMGVIDRLLGGPGAGRQPDRALSEIEVGLLRELVQRVVHEYRYAFESLADLSPRVVNLDSDPQFMQLASPSEPVVVSIYDVRIGDLEAEATLCLPFLGVDAALESLSSRAGQGRPGGGTAHVAGLVERLSGAPVDVSVQFGAVTVPSMEILGLQVGDVLPLRHRVTSPLNICAEGVPCAAAVPGSYGPRVACLVVEP